MTSLVLQDTPVQARRRFIADMTGIVGASNVRVLYVPDATEGLVVPDAVVAGRSYTHTHTPAQRITRQGDGYTLAMNGTSNGLTTPDVAALTFGNGAADSPFSIFSAANVTDTANLRAFFSKWTTAQFEYEFYVSAADKLVVVLWDNSAGVGASVTATASIDMGAMRTFGFTYTAVSGGAAAANDIVVYQSGVAMAAPATNNAGNVAMEDLTGVGEIGSTTASSTSFMQGQMGFVLVCAGALTAAQARDLNAAASRFYRI